MLSELAERDDVALRLETKREAGRNMDWCRVERSEGRIANAPHMRIKPEDWKWLTAESSVVVPETMDEAAAGAALRQALDLCGDWDVAFQ